MKTPVTVSGPVSFALFAALLCPAIAQEKLPTADKVFERFIEVSGGRPAYEKLRTQITIGTVELVGAGIKGRFIEYRSEPGKIYRSFDFADAGKIEAGANGDVAWERSSETGPRVKTGEDKTGALRDATFNALLHWRELYSKIDCTGKEIIGRQTCFQLLLTPKDGKPVTHWYDAESGLLVKVAMTSPTPTLGEIVTETLLADYRSVDGIRVPHQLRRRVLSQEILTYVQSVQFNTPIPEGRFDIPDDIRALLRK